MNLFFKNKFDLPEMGCYCHNPLHVLDDLYLHRSQEQLSPWKYSHPKVSPFFLRLKYTGTGLNSLLLLNCSYFVLLAGFYFAPPTAIDIDQGHLNGVSSALREFPALSWFQSARWYLQSFFQRGT